jgi:arginine deiminase
MAAIETSPRAHEASAYAGAPPYVGSDVDRLRTVVVHRPGDELLAVPPGDPGAALFAAPMDIASAQAEHDRFAAVLRAHDVEVLYVEELLAEALAARAIRSLRPERAAQALITGVAGARPLPNLLYTRDHAAWIGRGVVTGAMRQPARRREGELLAALYRTHPRFAGAPRWIDRLAGGACIEGGDVLLLGGGRLVVGVSERTTLVGAQRLAGAVLRAGVATEVLLLEVPPAAGFHLDLVLTMVDHGTLAFWGPARAGLRGRLCRMTPRGPLGSKLDDPVAWLAREARVVDVGDDDVPATPARAWDHGTNVLAIAPGVVVAYAENTEANRRLRAAGIEVIAIAGAALAAGRGGPHCLSCPVRRDPE